MRNSSCKQLRHRTKQLLTEWYKSLLPEEEQDNVSIDNIMSLLPKQKHIKNNHRDRIECSAFSFRWTYGKVAKNPQITVEELKVMAYGE